MEALDLTRRPPRGPREAVDGLIFLPRTIDKARALLPGGNPGDYKFDGFSSSMFEKLEIDEAAFVAAVGRAESDADVARWVRENAKMEHYPEIAERMSNRKLTDLKDPAGFAERYPVVKQRPDLVYLFDVLEADDAQAFAP